VAKHVISVSRSSYQTTWYNKCRFYLWQVGHVW